jgi:ABC-type uncharacterized transport system permease subunit
MSTRLIGIVIGLLVAAFYAIQLTRMSTGRDKRIAGSNQAASRIVAVVGLIIGLGVAAWWFIS